MDDQGIPARTLFGLEDLCDGSRVQSVGAQAVDSLRRERDDSPGAQNLGGPRDRILGAAAVRIIRIRHEPECLDGRLCAWCVVLPWMHTRIV